MRVATAHPQDALPLRGPFGRRGKIITLGLLACATAILAACGGGSAGSSTSSAAAPSAMAASTARTVDTAMAEDTDRDGFRTVEKATCGANDNPETGLQGQVPAALRASGFKGFSCNLKLIGQVRGDGANWQTTEFKDRSHKCAYHTTSYSTVGRTQLGVPVIDVTHPHRPTVTGYLTTTSMLDPWESLKVNERRQLLGADQGWNGGGGPAVDIYDVSGDCRYPQLLASVDVGKADGSTGVPTAVIGHEGTWAPDGMTYYGGDLRNLQYYAVDTSVPTAPKLITTWKPGIANVHGMSISDDGRRGYFVSLGGLGATPAAVLAPSAAATNGLLIYDLSEIQERKTDPQPKLISQLLWKDGSVAQHTINVKIHGRPYLIFVDEGGSGGISSAAQQSAACAANLTPFPLARIIDISDETKPRIVSRMALEVHDPANCSQTLPDLVGLSIFTYGSHYCSVDDRNDATTLACGYFNSGIRVFDIRDVRRPKEIAYYNPAGTTTASPGSNHTIAGNWIAGGPDWCSAQVHLDAREGVVWSTCQDNGLLVLKFERDVWPFRDARTPPGEQN
jgi:hypothetical protein